MRLPRIDLVPMLAIVAGGVMGATLSLRLVSSDDVPAPNPVVVSSATEADRIEADPVENSPDRRWAMYCPDTCGEPWLFMRMPKDGTARVDLSFRTDPENQLQPPLFYIDGVRIGSSDLSLELDAIESIETVRGAAAIALYGEGAFPGVVQITLKEDRS